MLPPDNVENPGNKLVWIVSFRPAQPQFALLTKVGLPDVVDGQEKHLQIASGN